MSLSRTESEFYSSYKLRSKLTLSYNFKYNDRNDINFFFQSDQIILGIS